MMMDLVALSSKFCGLLLCLDDILLHRGPICTVCQFCPTTLDLTRLEMPSTAPVALVHGTEAREGHTGRVLVFDTKQGLNVGWYVQLAVAYPAAREITDFLSRILLVSPSGGALHKRWIIGVSKSQPTLLGLLTIG
jgi:hypothetical protein